MKSIKFSLRTYCATMIRDLEKLMRDSLQKEGIGKDLATL